MNAWQRIRWLVFEFYFGVQRLFWWHLLHALLPDCTTLIDAKIIAKKSDATASEILDEIYKFLGILDAKASALMRYNSIILAVIALMAKGEPPHVTVYIVVMTIISILACLLVVGVYWRFLEWVNPDAPTNKLADELAIIRRVLIMREAAYQLAWWMSAAVLFLFLFNFREFLAAATPATAPKAG